MSLKLCYALRVQVATRDLRNNTRRIIDALESGDEITLTNHGKPVGRIVPIEFDMTTWLEAIVSEAPGGDDSQLGELLTSRDAQYAEPDRW